MNEPEPLDRPSPPKQSRWQRSWKLCLSLAMVAAAIGGLAIEVVVTRPIRDSLNVYLSLITVANRPDYTDEERVKAASELCTAAYLKSHKVAVAPQGGIVGIPRNISKNFKAWRDGTNVWICPTSRVGPIYQFIPEDGRWKFDGPIGLLRPWGEVVRSKDLQGVEEE